MCPRYVHPSSRFLSTPSARRATRVVLIINQFVIISIHALREEGDVDDGKVVCIALNFYPRPPRGGRPVIPLKLCGLVEISIHALREEGDAAPSRV